MYLYHSRYYYFSEFDILVELFDLYLIISKEKKRESVTG